ncbi:AAA family ATPase [Candidatus Comchoanobacter bicostacola]|uniref:AAA family ATPase n=1 Tax=Candidatus Comchoanobacter bicostacola TaxID=2919598 RepID=A0ABY5DK61_9GAMM|nr:AAA family ATPase [Candidatus Comchoanobacter bicostacola]UTC24545.1 AAA family ATPase [Candidatus Comchoanobacter bicostacola]
MVVATDTHTSVLDWSQLGLTSSPFSGRSSESNYLKEFSQSDVFAIAEKIDPVQIFVGVSGVGKTVHAKLLAKHLIKEKRRPTQLITASKTIKSMGLMKMVCCRFNIEMPPVDMPDFQKIEQIRRAVQKRKEPLALIIDDAQNLSYDTMSALLRLSVFQQKPVKMQVVMLGMPLSLDRVRKVWQELEVADQFVQGTIRPWDESKTEGYIISKLRDSGLQGSRQVCRKVCKQIQQLSGGIPMQVNRRSNMMLGQLIQGHKRGLNNQVKGNLLWGGALLSAVTVGVFCYKASLAPTAQSSWDESSIAAQMELSTQLVVGDVQDEETLMAALEVSEVVAVDESGEEVFNLFDTSGETELESSAVETSVDGSVLEDVGVVEVASLESDVSVFEETLVQSSDEWVGDSGFTVQVMATSEEKEALIEAERYDNSHVAHVMRNDQPTYVVLVGQFDTIEGARDEVQTISNRDERIKPWVRTNAQVLSDINQLHPVE